MLDRELAATERPGQAVQQLFAESMAALQADSDAYDARGGWSGGCARLLRSEMRLQRRGVPLSARS